MQRSSQAIQVAVFLCCESENSLFSEVETNNTLVCGIKKIVFENNRFVPLFVLHNAWLSLTSLRFSKTAHKNTTKLS